MRAVGSRYFSQTLKAACAVAGLVTMAPAAHAEPGAFAGLGGAWSGNGIVQIADGASERIRCRANYTVTPDGNNLRQLLRCASDSYHFDLSSDIVNRGGTLTGTWSEATRNITGDIAGRAANGQFKAIVTAVGFTAELSMVARGNKQTIAINSENTQFRGVQISLAR